VISRLASEQSLKDAHLTPADLDLLAAYRGEKVLNRILLHHLTVCPECRAVGGFLLDAYAAGELMTYGELPGFRIALARSRSEAPKLWLMLNGSTLQRQKAMVRKAKRLRSWGLAELLCRKSLEAAGEPVAAELAELAVEVAMLVRDFDFPRDESWVSLLRAFAWAHLGKARRSLGDFDGARVAFGEAQRIWESVFYNTGDVLGYEAAFRELLPVRKKSQRRSPEKAS